MKSASFVICGLGNVGYRAFHLLQKLGYEDITIITEPTAPEWMEKVRQAGAKLVTGDARNPRCLEMANISEATALIAATNNDRANLSVALDALKLNPKINTVVRLQSEDLSEPVRLGLDVRNAYCTQALAAPLFATSILGDHVIGYFKTLHQKKAYVLIDTSKSHHKPTEFVQLGGQPLYVVEGETLRKLNPDEKVSNSKDYLFLSRVQKELVHASSGNERSEYLGYIWEKFKAMIDPALEIKTLFGLIACAVGLSIVLFHYQLNMSWVDSLYFAISIVTTVGFGDFNLSEAPAWLKIYGGLLMFSGPALMAAFFSLVNDVLFSNKLKLLFGFDKTRKRNHTIVVGDGKLAQTIHRELQGLGFASLYFETENGKPASDLTLSNGIHKTEPADTARLLERAGISRARSVIAATTDDLENLAIGLNAKQMNPIARVLVRTFDFRLAEKLRPNVKVDDIISSSDFAAASFVASCLDDRVYVGVPWKNYLLSFRSDTHKDHDLEIQLDLSGDPVTVKAYQLDGTK